MVCHWGLELGLGLGMGLVVLLAFFLMQRVPVGCVQGVRGSA